MHVQRVAAFTDNGSGGNPAGVMLTATLLADREMQSIAADVGYSETVFAHPNTDGSWRIRYFSPETEVPFCGHATIALGAVLGETHGAGRYSLSLAHAEIDVSVAKVDGIWMSTLRSPPTRSSLADPELINEALSLFGYQPGDLDPAVPPCRANAGTEHLIMMLNTRAALARMDYDLDEGRQFMQRHGLGTVAFMYRESEELFHARNAFAIGGVLEDPATGAAAAAFAGMLRDLHIVTNGQFVILQGQDMGQPCRIEVEMTGVQGAPVTVIGRAATIA